MERYEAYKDSGIEWIGEIPEGWELRRLKTLGSTRSGMGNKRPDDFGSGLPFLSYKDVYSKESFHDASGLVKSTPDDCKKFSVQRGDAFFTGSSETIEELGFSSVCLTTIPDATFNGFTIRFRPGTPHLYPEYSAYLFRSDVFRGYLKQRDNSITRANLSQQVLGDAVTVLPSHQEQQAIADYLDAKTAEVDALVADCEREVELLREYRKAVISEAVTKGLDPDAPMKDSGVEWIGKIPEGWSTARTKQVCSLITDGSHYSPKTVEDGFPYITATNIRGRGIDYDSAKLIDKDEYEQLVQNGCRPISGDVLMVKDGATTGRAGLMIDSRPCVILSSVALMRPSHLCWSDYLFYFIQSQCFQEQVRVSMAGSAMPRTTLDKLVEYAIALPSVSEQRAIADYLDAKTVEVDSLIEAKQSMADKLREYRKSLISEAVTGKFKVPGLDAIS